MPPPESVVPAPRILPGGRREIGLLNAMIAGLIGAAAGSGPPNLFTTLARHRRLYRPWLRFAAALMPRGALPRGDSELVILRVAHNCASGYELAHHERLARREGLTEEQIARVAEGPGHQDWSAREAALLRATDELHEQRTLSDPAWDRLAAQLTETELIEVPMLVGHYEMLAMTLNSLRVPADEAHGPRGVLGRAAYGLAKIGRGRRG
ncbi:MAG: carboxymuconolactone decarboxylase family protein [Haloechinothrix sp.]